MSNPFMWPFGPTDQLVSLEKELKNTENKLEMLIDAIIRADQFEMNAKARDILHKALGET